MEPVRAYRFSILGAEVHYYVGPLPMVFLEVLNFEGRVRVLERVNAEDGLLVRMAPLPAAPRRLPLKVQPDLCRIIEMEQELAAVVGEN